MQPWGGVHLLDVLAEPAADDLVAPGSWLAPDSVLHPPGVWWVWVPWGAIPELAPARQQACLLAFLVHLWLRLLADLESDLAGKQKKI